MACAPRPTRKEITHMNERTTTRGAITLACLPLLIALGCANGLTGVQEIPLSANPTEQIQQLVIARAL